MQQPDDQSTAPEPLTTASQRRKIGRASPPPSLTDQTSSVAELVANGDAAGSLHVVAWVTTAMKGARGGRLSAGRRRERREDCGQSMLPAAATSLMVCGRLG